MYNKAFLIIFVVLLLGCISCNQSTKMPVDIICNGTIISFYDSANKQNITNYELYNVSNYPEGITMTLQNVNSNFIYKDKGGFICFPLFDKQRDSFPIKFVFVKEGYAHTLHYMLNPLNDTVFNVVAL